MPKSSCQIVVANHQGLHARPVMQLVEAAAKFQSTIKIIKEGDKPVVADAHSTLQLILLEALEGTPLRIEAEGLDADAAVAALAQLFTDKFGEE